MKHRYDFDTDRCVCGGVVVYFENGETGEGCEVDGHPWAMTLAGCTTWVLQELETGHEAPGRLNRGTTRTGESD